MDTSSIELRYAQLAETTCCLSCGGAADHGKAREGEICVDLGSGRGTDVLRMAETVGPAGLAVGIDATAAMIDKAQKNAEKLGVTNVRFIQSQLESLPLPEDYANLVISNCTINHAEDKQAAWNEIYRILQIGGRFVVSDIYSSEPVPDEYRNDPAAVAECWAGSVTLDEYMAQLEKAGFTAIRIIEKSEPYSKGKIMVSSFTVTGYKGSSCCCC